MSQISSTEKPDVSVVIPIYNSANIFPELHKRLVRTLEQCVRSFEIIAVLDGCRDTSYEVISKLSNDDKRIKFIEFSRNFGHQAALSAGLSHASGELVAIIDDDLEDPPELLPRFIEKIHEGFDVVYGIRRKRQRSFVLRFLERACLCKIDPISMMLLAPTSPSGNRSALPACNRTLPQAELLHLRVHCTCGKRTTYPLS